MTKTIFTLTIPPDCNLESLEFKVVFMIEILIIIFLVAICGVGVWLIRDLAGHRGAITQLCGQIDGLKTAHETIRLSLDNNLQNGQQTIFKSLEQHHNTLSALHGQIGELRSAASNFASLNVDVRRLNEILTSPKLRGQLGEWSLERLLANLLPRESFELQYSFADGKRVDALIKLDGFSVPVDAKFPLPAFEAIAKCENANDLPRLQKAFANDVCKHVDKIAASYIRPSEGTLDFAMMYIPAENVYYETIIRSNPDCSNIVDYALSKKVIPVSPNVLWAYVMTVVMGLHGLEIEKQAQQIRHNLSTLEAGFIAFSAEFKTMGNHIRNSWTKYEEADKRLTRFEMQLNHIKTDTPE